MKWCYKHYVEKTKPKNIFKKVAYKIWLWCGVSPSGLGAYLDNNVFKGDDNNAIRFNPAKKMGSY